MRPAWIVATLLVAAPLLSGQEAGSLRVSVTIGDAGQPPTPVARHVLLISDDPVTTVPRVVRTGADGTIDVALRPGAYLVESERAVVVDGRAYEWFQRVEVRAGAVTTLALGTANAEEGDLPATATAIESDAADPVRLLQMWQRSVVAVWSPTARATGVIVDARGLIATPAGAVGSATTVAVQVSATQKVPARVLPADAAAEVALLRVDPGALEGRPPVVLDCTSAGVPSGAHPVSLNDDIVALTAALGRPTDVVWGRATAVRPRAIETDISLAFGGAGGPVFDERGQVVGLTTLHIDPTRDRWDETRVVPAARLCETLPTAQATLAAAPPPPDTALPVEPERPFPADALEASLAPGRPAASPIVVTTDDFEVAFLTPTVMHHAREKAGWTGGNSGRAPEVEARLGRLTDLGSWSAYVADTPAVVLVRVTPRMVEGFWKRVAREAARTQGAVLPPFKQFATSFVQLTLTCGGTTVVPVQPFLLEHHLSETQTVREGLYVFDPQAFDPACGALTLTLAAEKAPDAPQTVVVDEAIVARIWSEFAPWRDTRR